MKIVEPVNISIIFYSMYGHTKTMAEAVSKGAQRKGAQRVDETIVQTYQVSKFVPQNLLKDKGARKEEKAFDYVPIATPRVLEKSDAVFFGTPTRFGKMASQMYTFLEQAGKQQAKGALIGKVGSVFTSIEGKYGGHEAAITSFHNTLIHLGMLVVGIPYLEQRLSYMREIYGESPYGATTVSGPNGSRNPSEKELSIAQDQGEYVAKIAKRVFYSELKLNDN